MRGSFSGPITTRAMTPMTSSSENPMSNIAVYRNKRRPQAPLCRTKGGSGLLLGLCLDLAVDRLAGHLRCGRVARLLAAFAHAVLESAHRAAKVGAHVAQLLGAEDQHHDQQDDQPVPDAERAHISLLSVSLQHRAQGLGPAENVHVDMIHLLMPDAAGVDDGAKAVV